MSHVDTMSRAPDQTSEIVSDSDRIMLLCLDKEDWLLTMQIRDSTLLDIIAVLKDQQQSPQAKQIKEEYCLSHGRLFRKEGGKLGFVVPKSVQRIKQHFWFAKMRKYVKEYISACVECCFNKSKNGKPEAQLYIASLEPSTY